MFGAYYSCSEILKEGWLHRNKANNRPKDLKAAYDPVSADTIYLFPYEDSRIYWQCNLTDRSRRFRGMTFWQVWELLEAEKKTAADYTIRESEETLKLNQDIEEITKRAKRFQPASYDSNAQRISEIRGNKKKAVDENRLKRAKQNTVDVSKPVADVVLLRPDEQDYSYPDLTAQLFEDDTDV